VFDLDGLERGPFVPADLPLAPALFGGPVFEPLVEPLVAVLGPGDGLLGAASSHVASDVPTDLDAAYQASAGQAEAAHADQVAAGADAQGGLFVDAGAGVEAYRASVLPHLPPPSADVVSDLTPPPSPPAELVTVPEPPETRTPE
jgi:hypothetical protein